MAQTHLFDDDMRRQVRAELDRLVVRRTRLGLVIILVGVLLLALADWSAAGGYSEVPAGVHVVNAVLTVVALALLSRPAVQRRPVPFAFGLFVVACAVRAVVGAWHGEVVSTAIICVAGALAAGTLLPWGALPQAGVASMAAAAIAFNAVAVGAAGTQLPGDAVSAVAIALAVSIAISAELHRHRVALVQDNLRRRQAEAALARLNDELERRVAERTAQLEGTKQGLEREVRERLQAVYELRDSRKRLQDILDTAPAVIHMKDTAGRYVLVNRHWEQLFHRRREDVIGKTMHDVYPAAIADALHANDRQVLESKRPLEFEELLPQDGEPRTFLSVKFPLVDSAGAVVGVCGISTDITARKAAEAELRRSEAALTALMDSTGDAIWSIDRNYDLTFVNASMRKRFREHFGTELDPPRYGDQVPDEIMHQMRALYDRALAGERVQAEQAYELQGMQRFYLISMNPILEDGRVTGATVFSQDITEHKRVEEQARQHQAQLAHVLRLNTMGEMAAGLAHEINQPLGAIANYAQGCVHRLRAGFVDAGKLLHAVEEIAREALRAGEVIRRLRDLVRKDSPRQEAVDVNALVREAVGIIAPEARRAGVDIHVDAAPDLPDVTCDGIQIEQVVVNLLLNGVDAMQGTENGDRTLTVLTARSGAGAVEVAVRDTGVGLPAPPADVFSPFFTTKPHGLGMGLSISRSIIEAHGGRLWATPNPDRGSTFRFTLPLAGGDFLVPRPEERHDSRERG